MKYQSVPEALEALDRYQQIDRSLPVSQVPERWNELYREYLGIEVPDDRQGSLQDSHWSGGSIGYFPSYALGGAYGAQMLSRMEADLGDIFEEVAKGNLAPVTRWLRERIHRFASFKKPGELFRDACGEFDPAFYTRYLTDKYTALYGLEKD